MHSYSIDEPWSGTVQDVGVPKRATASARTRRLGGAAGIAKQATRVCRTCGAGRHRRPGALQVSGLWGRLGLLRDQKNPIVRSGVCDGAGNGTRLRWRRQRHCASKFNGVPPLCGDTAYTVLWRARCFSESKSRSPVQFAAKRLIAKNDGSWKRIVPRKWNVIGISIATSLFRIIRLLRLKRTSR